MTRHPHADLIIAWANGAKIEYFHRTRKVWEDSVYPRWTIGVQYRVKNALDQTDQQVMDRLRKLERDIDAIGNTRIRHKLSELIQQMRLTLIAQEKYHDQTHT